MSRQQIQMANLLMNLIMSVILTVLATLILTNGAMDWGAGATWEGLVQTWLAALCIGFTVGDLLPSIEWGTKLGIKLGAKPGSLGNYIAQCVVLAFVMVTMIVAILMLIKVGFAPWWAMSTKVYLPLLGAALVVILATLKPVMSLVLRGSAPAAAEPALETA